MTIQVSFSGHATGDDSESQKAAEGRLIDHMRSVVRQFQEDGHEVYSASFSSQHHKTGDLRDAPEVVESSDKPVSVDEG